MEFCLKLFPYLLAFLQGAVLSPTLFSLFTNDLSYFMNCFLVVYADDTTLILECEDNEYNIRDSIKKIHEKISTYYEKKFKKW